MGISLMTNVTSLNAQRNLNKTNMSLSDNIGRLSSGLRINRAGDDAAGLGVSARLSSQIRGFTQAERNANDGVSMLQTAEGGMGEIGNILSRMRELAVQGSNGGTLGTTERGYLDNEFKALSSEIDRISNVSEYNGQKLLDGSLTTTGADLQVGIFNTANDRINVKINDVRASTLGVSTLGLTTAANAQTALAAIDTAITTVSTARGSIGAAQNRLTSAVNNVGTQKENYSAANSRILDVDVAEESSQLSRNQVLVQAGVAVLAQANQMPSYALSLLRG
jgi:flagellin